MRGFRIDWSEGQGATCDFEYKGGFICYTEPGACADGQLSSQVSVAKGYDMDYEWSYAACSGIAIPMIA